MDKQNPADYDTYMRRQVEEYKSSIFDFAMGDDLLCIPDTFRGADAARRFRGVLLDTKVLAQRMLHSVNVAAGVIAQLLYCSIAW